jgi:putative DNA methylase
VDVLVLFSHLSYASDGWRGIRAIMTIERRFDIPLIASLALKEKQIQQNYRPIIAVHKWFARRPGTLFRGLLLSEFASDLRLDEAYFNPQDFEGRVVADPFMGGGTPLVEANRVGCDVVGCDINPMSAWIVREEIEHLDHGAYQIAARRLIENLRRHVEDLYVTDCPIYGDKDVPVKYFLWVKTMPCGRCSRVIDLFPGYLVSDKTRHPLNVLVCAACGELNEIESLEKHSKCTHCKSDLKLSGPARRGRCACPDCGFANTFSSLRSLPLDHRLFAIEYYNPRRKAEHRGRFFKRPDSKDLDRLAKAASQCRSLTFKFVPNDEIPAGDETNRLHRWGYRKYSDLFNPRQLLGLELSCREIRAVSDRRLRHALATNLSDLLRYQNMLCRYDTMALKSLDIFSVHGFPVGLVQCESNLIGVTNGNGGNVGSGGWTNVVDKYAKAKKYCDAPFEIKHDGSRKVQVPIPGEWIGETRTGSRSRNVVIRCKNAADLNLSPCSLDAVFTDPPYFANVQYAELMDFCFTWLRILVGSEAEGFDRNTTRAAEDLTVNSTEGRGLTSFTEGLARVYSEMAKALKPGAPLAFTYHHNRVEAYYAIGVAVLDSGLTCSASLPCPAEMSGSIHIHGTTSSIVDTVFVCRIKGSVKKGHVIRSITDLTRVVHDDIGRLRIAGVKVTAGDTRCIIFGHLTRMAIWNLRQRWETNSSTKTKLADFAAAFAALGHCERIVEAFMSSGAATGAPSVNNLPLFFMEERDAVAF